MSSQFNTFHHKYLASLVAMLVIGVALCISHNDAYSQVRGRFSLTGNVVLPATASTLIGTLSGVELRLVNSSGTTIDVVSASSSGAYLFSNVTTGVFTVIPRRIGGSSGISSSTTFSPTSATIEVTSDLVRIPTFLMQPDLPIISGRVVMLHDWSVPFPFANITIRNTAVPTIVLRPQVQNNGSFSAVVSTAGTYSIEPEALRLREGVVITPAGIINATNVSTSVFVGINGETTNNPITFTATTPTYRVSGAVRFEYEPSAAIVNIETLSPQTGAVIGRQVTLATVTGNDPYFFYVTNGTYRITSRLTSGQAPQYTGAPTQHTINVRTADIGNLNFLYEPRIIEVRGRILRTVGNVRLPVPNILLRLSQFNTNLLYDSVQTASDGSFTLRLQAIRSTLPLYVLLPGPNEYTFTYNDVSLPTSEYILPRLSPTQTQTVAFLDIGEIRQNITLNDIMATPAPPRRYTVTGRVVYRGSTLFNQPIREALTVVVVNETNPQFLITERRRITLNNDGIYTLSLTSGNYTVSFLADRHIIQPMLRRFIVPLETDNTTQNFTAVLEPITLTGVVQSIVGTPLAGITVSLTIGQDGITTTTDENGRYRLLAPEQVPDGRFFIVPSTTATAFFPPSRLVVVNTATPALSSMDFRATSTIATLPLSAISGRITFRADSQERGLQGVTISDGTRTTRTDANGNYLLENVPNGRYTLAASLEGYGFTPPSLNVNLIGGTRPRNQNFVAQFYGTGPNRAPVLVSRPNDVPVIAASTTRVPISSLFIDPNGDPIAFTTFVEDPTILRTRLVDGFLLIDALTEGNTMITLIANDNRGGTTTTSFRVTVNRPVVSPTIFVRSKGNINTNYNAALVIQSQTLMNVVAQAMANSPSDGTGKDHSTAQSFNGELGAFNTDCECVGSVVWTGSDAVLPVWAENKENGIPGMRPNEPLDIRFVDNIERKSRRGIGFVLLGGGGSTVPLWPIDQGILNIAELTPEPCVAAFSSVVNVQHSSQRDALRSSIHPNPANSRARLSYTLASGGRVTIEMWNSLGQKVMHVFEGFQYAGEQRVEVNLDDMPTGMYLCRIRRDGTASQETSTLRISVIR
ncbi:MAG: T9SS C-terminal target domain-containing protein [Candidatus Kapaibacterium sp.]|nr:MAG: T9SS C-terminal target domain-containing protein [Candidatus Kapabacteria bacterium]